jgi:LmbE family N-acetylglucosaminyl deacetylase
MSRRAFAIAAHPDDIEFSMAGTLLHLREAGYEIHYMNVANGGCGSTTFDAPSAARIRLNEARRACQLVGAVHHDPLTNDLEIFYERSTLARLAATVREVAPEIILTHSPSDYMEDHTNTCRLVVTAAFGRGMANFRVEPPLRAINQPVTVYHAQPDGNCDSLGQIVWPSLFVDIELVLNEKTVMLGAHQSQREWLSDSQGLDSLLQFMHDRSREVGQMSGKFTYAEGWRKHSHLGFCAADADPLGKALPRSCLIRNPETTFTSKTGADDL